MLHFIEDKHGVQNDWVVSQHDEAQTRTCNYTKGRLVDAYINTMAWPAKSTDLIAIEIVSGALLRAFYEGHRQLKSSEDLTESVMHA